MPLEDTPVLSLSPGPGNFSLQNPWWLLVSLLLDYTFMNELVISSQRILFGGSISFSLGSWRITGQCHFMESAALLKTAFSTVISILPNPESWTLCLKFLLAHSLCPGAIWKQRALFSLCPFISFCSIPFHFYSLESPVSITTFSMGSFGRKSSFTKVSLSQLFGGSPCPPPFPFNLCCAPWPGPLSSTQAFWEPGLLKMVITAGFLLVPRLFLFTKAGQAWPLRGTHIRVGIFSRPLGYSSLTFFIETFSLKLQDSPFLFPFMSCVALWTHKSPGLCLSTGPSIVYIY